MPASTSWSEPFWEGVRLGQLRLPWCDACDRPHFPPKPFCPHCWSDELAWRNSPGRGTLYSFTTVRAYPPSAFVDHVPFTIAVVRLDEGVQLLTHIKGDVEDLEVDAAVVVRFREPDDFVLPVFVPIQTDAP